MTHENCVKQPEAVKDLGDAFSFLLTSIRSLPNLAANQDLQTICRLVCEYVKFCRQAESQMLARNHDSDTQQSEVTLPARMAQENAACSAASASSGSPASVTGLFSPCPPSRTAAAETDDLRHAM